MDWRVFVVEVNVECNPAEIRLRIRTSEPYAGRIYPRGLGKSACERAFIPKLKFLKQRHPDWIRRPTDELQHSRTGYPGEIITEQPQFSQLIFRTTIRNQGSLFTVHPYTYCIKKIEEECVWRNHYSL